MSDFDFEELDKAVNGALGSPARAAEPVQATPLPVAQPADDRSSVAGEQRPAPRAGIVPAANRGGRFMDVVHPSSDMRTPAPSQSEASSSQPQAMGLPRIPQPPSFSPADATRSAVEYTPAIEEPVSREPADWTKPLESPFLPDAKVEKRPLGGTGSDFEPSVSPLVPEEGEVQLLEAPEDELLLEAATMPDPLDFSVQQPEVAEAHVEAVPAQAPVPTPEPTQAPVESVKSVEDMPEEPSVPIAITQQYKEKQSDEQESGAIYDTESYHQPLVKPVKQRSGVWTALWIALLLLLGAGVGVVCYFYVLPLL